MPKFDFSARDSEGRPTQGQIEASSAVAVAQRLQAAGSVPLRIEPASVQRSDADLDARTWLTDALRQLRRVRIDELIMLSHQMASLMRAGVPIVRAMRGLAESSRNQYLREVLLEVTTDLEAGTDLASALKRHGRVFSDLYVSVIHVGENTGQLDEAFKRVAQYLELERETAKRVKSATRYPMFVMIAIGIAIAILNLFVIPAFAEVFLKFDAELPWQTRVLLAVSQFFVDYYMLMLLLAIAVWYGLRRYLRTSDGRLRWDYWKLRLPILGSIYERINLARFCQTFAMVMQAGVPITQGLSVVANAIGNSYMAGQIRGMRQGVERGESITQTARSSGMFTPVVLQMIAVGEETGSVDELLRQAGGFYEEEVDYELKQLTDAIEPILIIAIGAMVLVLALGVFLPLWDLSGVAIN